MPVAVDAGSTSRRPGTSPSTTARGQQDHPEPEVRHRIGADAERGDPVVGACVFATRRRCRAARRTPPTAPRRPPPSAIVGPALRLISPQTGWSLGRSGPGSGWPSPSGRRRTGRPWTCRAELLRERVALVLVRLRPRSRFATGSPSTTRNRKKLKQMTKSSVTKDPRTLALMKRRSLAFVGGAAAPHHEQKRSHRERGRDDDRDDRAAAASVVTAASRR